MYYFGGIVYIYSLVKVTPDSKVVNTIIMVYYRILQPYHSKCVSISFTICNVNRMVEYFVLLAHKMYKYYY